VESTASELNAGAATLERVSKLDGEKLAEAPMQLSKNE
jgi:hypothetical protein